MTNDTPAGGGLGGAGIIRAALDKLADKLQIIEIGTVISSFAPGGETMVILDSDPDQRPVRASALSQRYAKGARVYVLVYPPRGLLVLGLIDPPADLVLTAPSMQVLLAGSTVWNKPANLLAIRVRAVGGGGSGGGAPAVAGGQSSCGGGGQGGMYCESYIPASSLPSAVGLSVPAGVSSAAGLPGVGGGAAQFGAFVVATGGAGGSSLAAGATVTLVSGGSGFVAGLVGQITIVGNDGSPGIRLAATAAMGGNGGGSMLGGGGRGSGTLPLTGGWNFGGGGGGAATGGAAVAGGPGAAAVIIVEHFFQPA